MHELPLQHTLVFSSPPTDIAASYLQTMCFSEGLRLNRAFVEHVYEGTRSKSGGDLRKAIHSLQLNAGRSHECSVRSTSDWKIKRSHFIDTLSYMDSYLHERRVYHSSVLDFYGDARPSEVSPPVSTPSGLIHDFPR